MTELIEDLPGDWERDRVSEDPNPTYTYRHQYSVPHKARKLKESAC